MNGDTFTAYLENIKRNIFRDIDNTPLERLSPDNIKTLTEAYLTRNCRVSVPNIDWSKESADKNRVPLSYTGLRQRGVPPGYPGFGEDPLVDRYTVAAPFVGDEKLLSLTVRNYIRVPDAVRPINGKLLITIDGPDLKPENARKQYEQIKSAVQSFVQALTDEYGRFTESMKVLIPERMNQRRSMLEKDQNDLKAFGIPKTKDPEKR